MSEESPTTPCPNCDGYGYILHGYGFNEEMADCPACKGAGILTPPSAAPQQTPDAAPPAAASSSPSPPYHQ